MSADRTHLIYDLPTRTFHWLFAGSFLTAFLIANVADDSAAFPYHMLAGALVAGLAVFRLAWGIFGTRHARFRSFALRPRDLLGYFREMLGHGGRTWAGHNPASSWTALLMLALAAGLGITGCLMVSGGDRERFEEVHELFANSFLALALLHVTGVVLHLFRHRDRFVRSMLDGRKRGDFGSASIARARPLAAVVLSGAFAAALVGLVRGYDPASGSLHVFGTTLLLAEQETPHQVAFETEHEGGGNDD